MGGILKLDCVLPSHITSQLIGFYSDANGKYLHIMLKSKETHVTCKHVTEHIGKQSVEKVLLTLLLVIFNHITY